jgi:hypothetical protein
MWYFVENGSRKGPVSLEELQSLIAQEIITSTTLVWKRGMDDWLVVGETELKDLLPKDMPPPIPVSEPPQIPQIPELINTPHNTSATPIFFPVSGFKLFVMSVGTGGFYDLYWFYKNWKLIRLRDRSDIMPFWRSCFAFIFSYPLFKRIKNASALEGIASEFSPLGCTLSWTLRWFLFGFSPNPFVQAFSYLGVLALLPIQANVNQLNQKVVPQHNPNNSFSAGNLVAIVVVSGLTILGFMLPE